MIPMMPLLADEREGVVGDSSMVLSVLIFMLGVCLEGSETIMV